MALRNTNAVRLLVTDEALYVANTGRPIDRRGVISIARQYLSSKGETPPDDTFACADRYLVDEIRKKRLNLYREEPNDLKEHASQETQTRRDYAGRALWELLQNADDAMAPAGAPSNELIGAKGLGFKSVLEISERPEIHSGAFHFGFDPDRSDALLRKVTSDPPKLVFRLPHPVKADAEVKKMRAAGFTTIVKLPFKDKASGQVAGGWLAALPHHFMLLCQHLVHFEAHLGDGTFRQFSRQGGQLNADAARAILKIAEGGRVRQEEWRVWSRVWPSLTRTEKRLSAAIAIQVDGKQGMPTAEELPFHVFYPTLESVLAPFLVHASMELRSDRNHLLSGAHDSELLSALGELATAAAKYLTPESVLDLFRGLAKPPPANVSKMDRKIQRVLGRAVLDTAFVPTVGGALVQPADAQTWAHDLPTVLNHKSPTVRAARLCDPAITEAFPALKAFGAEALGPLQYAEMLNYTNCRDRSDCLKASRIAHQACLTGFYVASNILNALSNAPFWFTSTGKIRPLTGDRPLVRSRPDAWPDWLAADDLDAQFAADLLGQDAGVEKSWGSLVNGRLLQSTDDMIVHCLAPLLKTWSEKTWSKRGWEALSTILAWRPDLEWSKIKPFAQGLSPDPEPARTALIEVARIPRESAWVVSADSYASPKIGGNSDLAEFYREKTDRPIVGMPPTAKTFGNRNWRALLRYLGVSWEPKIRRFNGWNADGCTCLSRYWNAVTESRLNYREVDWYLDYFPECVQPVSAQGVAKMLEALIPVTSKLTAAYNKRSDSSASHRPTPFASCADYQLRRESYLPCHPSLTHAAKRAIPSSLYWPECGIRGITPILDLGGLPLAKRQRLRTQFAQRLGIQEDLPTSWAPWLVWTDQLAEAVDGDQFDVKERFVRDFYELFLRVKFVLPKPRAVKRVVCVTEDGLRSVPATEAVWIDEPRFAAPEVQRALISAGLAVFPPMLERGDGSVGRLGVRRASDVVQVIPKYITASANETDRLTKRLHQRRRAFAAICEKKHEHWTDPPSLTAVHGLTLAFKLDGNGAGTRAAPAFQDGRNWLVNLDGDPWEALAVVCSAPFRSAADLRHWFAAILKARSSAEIAGILTDGGIPIYRLREIALPEDEADDEPYTPIPQTTDQRVTSDPSQAAGDETSDEPAGGNPRSIETGSSATASASNSRAHQPEQRDFMDDPEANFVEATLKKRPLYGASERDPTERGVGGGRAVAATSAARAAARGLEAEAWFAQRLHETLPNGWQPEFNVRDAEVRESDVVLTSSTEIWHIEIKCLTETRIYWSQLEQQKAEAHPGRYCMAFLVRERSGYYRIYWSWDPLADLLACERRIDWVWEGTGQGPPLPPDSWEPLTGLKRPERAANRMNFVIELRDDFLRALLTDDRNLRRLWAKVTAPPVDALKAAE